MRIVFCPARATIILLAALVLHPGISLSAERGRPAYGRAHDSAVSRDKGKDGRETTDPVRRGNDAAEAKRPTERDTSNERRANKPATAVETVGRNIDFTKGNKGEFRDADALLANIKAQDGSARAEKLSAELIARRNEKGNYGLGTGTHADAARLGREWVGENARLSSDGKAYISKDGLRQYRPPSFKPTLGREQANYEKRLEPNGKWTSNGHLDITQ